MRNRIVLLVAAVCLVAVDEAACQSRKDPVVPYAVEILEFDARGFTMQQRGGGDEEYVAFDDIAAFRTKNGKLHLRLVGTAVLATSLPAGDLGLPDDSPWQRLPPAAGRTSPLPQHEGAMR